MSALERVSPYWALGQLVRILKNLKILTSERLAFLLHFLVLHSHEITMKLLDLSLGLFKIVIPLYPSM
jgi:hypothetical protein